MRNPVTLIYNKLPRFVRNKYLLTIIVFLVWIMLFDNNNLIDRYSSIRNLKQLEHDREYYINRIEEDTRKLNELRTNNENLEKFAREEYLMKKDDEDIFIVISEEDEKRERRR